MKRSKAQWVYIVWLIHASRVGLGSESWSSSHKESLWLRTSLQSKDIRERDEVGSQQSEVWTHKKSWIKLCKPSARQGRTACTQRVVYPIRNEFAPNAFCQAGIIGRNRSRGSQGGCWEGDKPCEEDKFHLQVWDYWLMSGDDDFETGRQVSKRHGIYRSCVRHPPASSIRVRYAPMMRKLWIIARGQLGGMERLPQGWRKLQSSVNRQALCNSKHFDIS